MNRTRSGVIAVVLLAFVPALASGKAQITVTAAPETPRVGDVVSVTVRALVEPDRTDECRKMDLNAVAPGFTTIDALRRLDAYPRTRPVLRRVFRLRSLRPVGVGAWTARIAFPVKGPWRLVVPNFCGAQGYVLPAGVTTLVVAVAARE